METESKKIKKYNRWYKVFLIVGFFGLLDIITGVLLKQADVVFFEGVGGLTFLIIYVLAYLFGTEIATTFLPFVMFVSGTWFIWLGISAILRRKIKRLEKEIATTKKPAEKTET